MNVGYTNQILSPESNIFVTLGAIVVLCGAIWYLHKWRLGI